jgi:hypothetical protein
MAREAFKPTPADSRHMVNLPESANDLPNEVIVDLDSKEPGKFEIVVEDDTPEADRGKPTKLNKSLADEEADLRGVSDKVQKRIDRIRYEAHTERRGREAAERERDAAAQLARDQLAEIERLRKITESSSTALASSMKAEREARIIDAERRLGAAHAEGNSAEVAKATRDLTAAQAELTQIAATTPRPRAEQQTQEQPRQVQQQVALKPNVAAWISHNDRWFNKDASKTKLAYSIHETLISRGVKDDSPEYTRELDKGLKAVYPDHEPYEVSDDSQDEGSSVSPRRTNAVERGGREDSQNAPNPNPRKVALTQSELSLAKRMRIPVEVYAAEKLRRQQNEKGGA